MGEDRDIDSPAGPLRLRPQRDEDAPFLRALFAVDREPMLRLSGQGQAQIDVLIDFQHRSREQAYRSQFPEGRFWIVEQAGRPIGRLLEADEEGAIYVVDIAVAPACQRHGVARALVTDSQSRAAAVGLGVRAMVAIDNGPSLGLFASLGFEIAPTDGMNHVCRWR